MALTFTLASEFTFKPSLDGVPNGLYKDAASEILARNPHSDAKKIYSEGFRVIVTSEDWYQPIGVRTTEDLFEIFQPLSFKSDKNKQIAKITNILTNPKSSTSDNPFIEIPIDMEVFYKSRNWYGKVFNKTMIRLHETDFGEQNAVPSTKQLSRILNLPLHSPSKPNP